MMTPTEDMVMESMKSSEWNSMVTSMRCRMVAVEQLGCFKENMAETEEGGDDDWRDGSCQRPSSPPLR